MNILKDIKDIADKSLERISNALRFLIPLSLMILIFSNLFLYLETFFFYLPLVLFPNAEPRIATVFSLLVWFLCLLFFVLVFSPSKLIKKQKIHNQPSWFKYYYFSLIFSPLISFFLFVFDLNIDIWGIGKLVIRNPLADYCYVFTNTLEPCYSKLYSDFLPTHVGNMSTENLISLIIRVLIILAGLLYYRLIKAGKQDISLWRFAPDTIGYETDLLGWTKRAEQIALGLLGTEASVSVKLIEAPLGEGKSSFAKLIVESYSKNNIDILYTYISLTETNEARDFSKLFAERWKDTLNERYPKIDNVGNVALLKTILRENGNGFISSIFEFFSTKNKGIFNTEVKFFDGKFVSSQKSSIKYATDEVASIFGNVVKIDEPIWIIAIDEIDRAPVDEVYRAIEVMERFKYEGRTGLPVRIVFLLCVDRGAIQRNMGLLTNSNSKAPLISDFFSSKKNFDEIYRLPMAGRSKKVEFIIQKTISAFRLSGQFTERQLKRVIPEIRLDSFTDEVVDTYSHGYIKSDERASYIISFLSLEPLRVIIRTIDDFQKSLSYIKSQIYWADLLTLSYIKINYPELINFFVATIDHLTDTRFSWQNYFRWEDKKDGNKKKWSIGEWIEYETGMKISETEKTKILRLLGLAAHSYIDLMNGQKIDKVKYKEENSSSLPENLQFYLEQTDRASGVFVKNYDMYVDIQRGKRKISDLKDEEIYDLSQFTRNTNSLSVDSSLFLGIAEEIRKRFILGEVKIEPKFIDSIDKLTTYTALTYEFCYCLLWAVENYKNDSKVIIRVVNLIVSMLKGQKVTTQSKFMIVNSLVNKKEGGRGDVGFRFERMWEQLISKGFGKELISVIQYVFEDANKRYFSGNRDIYVNEEKYVYVMYQYWSGDSNDKEEIEAIRKCALRNLSKHEDIIDRYWSLYPDMEYLNAEDDWHLHTFMENGAPLYMPAKNLIEVTLKSRKASQEAKRKARVWKKKLSEISQKYPRFFEVKSKDDTLRGFIIRDILPK